MTDFVTAFDISLGSALLPRPLERHINKGGNALSLSPPGATPSYLWLARSPDADPVVDVQILYDDEPTPEGFKKLARDLSGGSAAKVYLAYRTSPLNDTTAKGVVAVALLKDDENAGKLLARLLANLSRT
jgi:hypothetical protein